MSGLLGEHVEGESTAERYARNWEWLYHRTSQENGALLEKLFQYCREVDDMIHRVHVLFGISENGWVKSDRSRASISIVEDVSCVVCGFELYGNEHNRKLI